MPNPRRLNDADTAFVRMGAATGAPYVPVAVTVYERPYDDPSAAEHLTEVMSRLLPGMRQRIAQDRLSLALPRWEDVPGFDPDDHTVVLPAPGAGDLRAVLDWAQAWSRLDLPLDRPPWRSAHFEGVTVDGVPGRMVVVSQFHHALIDGQGAAKLAERFYQWGPGGPLPGMPPPMEPDASTRWERWRSGWADEGTRARALARNTAQRVRWVAANPRDGLARARELVQAMQRIEADQGPTPKSPLLRRTSDRNRFDLIRIDLDALRASARLLGASANDGFMAGMSIGLNRYHHDRGVKVPELRAIMAINTRAADAGHLGNDLIGAFLGLPLLDDAETALKACQAVSRARRDDKDALWLMDRFRAASNRAPAALVARQFERTAKGLDLSLSNVKGMPIRNWIGGVEALETAPFLIGGPAVAATLVSGPSHATLGLVTCPEAIPDPEHLVARLEEAFAEIVGLTDR